MQLEALKELDLSNGQIRVYSAVLETGITTLYKIQEKTGIERRNIYDILNKLIEKGLITYTMEKGLISVHIQTKYKKKLRKNKKDWLH